MTATWTVLGAGSAIPRAEFGPSGHLLDPGGGEPPILVDCGPGTLRALPSVGATWTDVRRVVVTHFHVDHCLDLAALAFARRNPAADAPPLLILAPVGVRKVLDGLEAAFGAHARFDDTTVRTLAPEAGAEGIALGGARLRWAPNGHTRDAVSVAFELPGGARVAYTGDTGPSEAVESLARGADLLVAECSFPDHAAVAKHLTPRTAAELARRAGAKRLLLVHFYPMLDPAEAAREAARTFDGPIETARDGTRHRVARADEPSA